MKQTTSGKAGGDAEHAQVRVAGERFNAKWHDLHSDQRSGKYWMTCCAHEIEKRFAEQRTSREAPGCLKCAAERVRVPDRYAVAPEDRQAATGTRSRPEAAATGRDRRNRKGTPAAVKPAAKTKKRPKAEEPPPPRDGLLF